MSLDKGNPPARDLLAHTPEKRPVHFEDDEATPSPIPPNERWRMFREMIEESDAQRRQDLARRYYRIVNQEMLASYRQSDGPRGER